MLFCFFFQTDLEDFFLLSCVIKTFFPEQIPACQVAECSPSYLYSSAFPLTFRFFFPLNKFCVRAPYSPYLRLGPISFLPWSCVLVSSRSGVQVFPAPLLHFCHSRSGPPLAVAANYEVLLQQNYLQAVFQLASCVEICKMC